MSTKHIRTAADLLRFGAGVKVECRSCGSAPTFSGAQTAKACGGGGMASTAARLKCGRCSAKAAKLTILAPL